MNDTNAPTPPDDLVRVVFVGRGPDAYVRLAEEEDVLLGELIAVVPKHLWDAYRLAAAQAASAYALLRRYADERAEPK